MARKQRLTHKLLEGILSVLFPELCPCCGKVLISGEHTMCLSCRLSLPITNFHLSPTDNEMRSKLNGLIPVERATAFFYYHRQSPHAKILHEAKYHGRPRLAQLLAREYAEILKSTDFFCDIDAVTPVPLNFWRKCRRGYNQSYYIAKGISQATNLPICDTLKSRYHSSQTRMTGSQRQAATKNVFAAKAGSLKGLNHILIIDDIATTGATLYACCEALSKESPGIRISVLTLASTRLI
ncbi:MAG: ComF family protein [Bacteroidales bacterium]|nr:ComF family protein [Bacteroidales bacterium]